MDNIEIKRTPQIRRNMESLLEESAIDNEFNYEAQQIRQAYSKTIKDLNQRIKEFEKQIIKYENMIQDKDNTISYQQRIIGDHEIHLSGLCDENAEIKKVNTLITKKLQQAEYKLETIEKNRQAVAYMQQQTQDNEEYLKKMNKIKTSCKKEISKQISQALNIKISKFLKEIKKLSMSVQVQQTIQSFLEEIIYLNSNENKNNLFDLGNTANTNQDSRNRQIGKISQRKGSEKLSEMEEWKKMEKSLTKLKSGGKYTDEKRVSRNEQRKDDRKVRGRLDFCPSPSPSPKPIINYI